MGCRKPRDFSEEHPPRNTCLFSDVIASLSLAALGSTPRDGRLISRARTSPEKVSVAWTLFQVCAGEMPCYERIRAELQRLGFPADPNNRVIFEQAG